MASRKDVELGKSRLSTKTEQKMTEVISVQKPVQVSRVTPTFLIKFSLGACCLLWFATTVLFAGLFGWAYTRESATPADTAPINYTNDTAMPTNTTLEVANYTAMPSNTTLEDSNHTTNVTTFAWPYVPPNPFLGLDAEELSLLIATLYAETEPVSGQNVFEGWGGDESNATCSIENGVRRYDYIMTAENELKQIAIGFDPNDNNPNLEHPLVPGVAVSSISTFQFGDASSWRVREGDIFIYSINVVVYAWTDLACTGQWSDATCFVQSSLDDPCVVDETCALVITDVVAYSRTCTAKYSLTMRSYDTPEGVSFNIDNRLTELSGGESILVMSPTVMVTVKFDHTFTDTPTPVVTPYEPPDVTATLTQFSIGFVVFYGRIYEKDGVAVTEEVAYQLATTPATCANAQTEFECQLFSGVIVDVTDRTSCADDTLVEFDSGSIIERTSGLTTCSLIVPYTRYTINPYPPCPETIGTIASYGLLGSSTGDSTLTLEQACPCACAETYVH